MRDDEVDFVPTLNIQANTLQKGEVREGKQLVAWDCIQDCSPAACPIGHDCVYKNASRVTGKCDLQSQYLQSFVETIFRTYRYLDEADMFRIGMHLVPLYGQLCQMKIIAKSVASMAYEDDKGRTLIHPIFKEIRETLKTITVIWKEIGMTGVPVPNLPGGDSSIHKHGGYGDPSHYTEISKGSETKRNVVR
jgi:hypothetical protein